MIKAFIFDMDGVILDSETICDRCWIIAAKEFGIKDYSKALKSCLGCNKTDSAIILKKLYGQDFDSQKFLLRTSELFHEIEEKEGVPLMPYAKEILEYLKNKYRIVLATSTRKETALRQLTKAGVLDYFETITSGDMVEHSKPEPEIYLKAIDSIGLNADECVAVEDSPNGIRSAYGAKLTTIMIPDKIIPDDEIKNKCNYIFSSLKEIQEKF